MKPSVIVDAGPLVALLNVRDAHHKWAVEQLKGVAGPMLTCEAAVSEALFLLRTVEGGVSSMAGLLMSGGLRVAFSMGAQLPQVCHLLKKYADVPMSLADACLVRMSELDEKHRVMTLDEDFRFYRRHRNRVLPLLMPD